MSVFDELDEKARELAAKAKAAIENPDEFFAKARERVEEAVSEAKDDIEEFANDAKEEIQGIRERMADMLECDSHAKASTATPTAPAADAALTGEQPSTTTSPPET